MVGVAAVGDVLPDGLHVGADEDVGGAGDVDAESGVGVGDGEGVGLCRTVVGEGDEAEVGVRWYGTGNGICEGG